MSTLRTAGDLRAFLAETLTGIRDGKIDAAQANAIAKVSAQINQSLAVEVNTALQLERMTGARAVAGSMVIADYSVGGDLALASSENEGDRVRAISKNFKPDHEGKAWCGQCERRKGVSEVVACQSPFCIFLEQPA